MPCGLDVWSRTRDTWTLDAPLGILGRVVKSSKETEEESQWVQMVLTMIGREGLRVLLYEDRKAQAVVNLPCRL